MDVEFYHRVYLKYPVLYDSSMNFSKIRLHGSCFDFEYELLRKNQKCLTVYYSMPALVSFNFRDEPNQ